MSGSQGKVTSFQHRRNPLRPNPIFSEPRRTVGWRRVTVLTFWVVSVWAAASPIVRAQTVAATQGPVKITLDDAIQLALKHNHNLLAAQTTIEQDQELEKQANLRPNPALFADWEYLPLSSSGQNISYLNNSTEGDIGLSYLFERGKKRQHRLQAAKDATAVTRSQVADNERGLTFQVASLFVNVQLAQSTLELAQQDLKTFQKTV